MKKTKTLLMLMLMALAIGCGQTPEQKIEEQGLKKMKELKKDGYSDIRKMIVDNLKYPESYKPISTDMAIVTNKMLIYDSKAFVTLRDLHYAIKNYKKKYGDNDSFPQEALQELAIIQKMGDIVHDRINAINDSTLEFEGIDVYHQFYANEEPRVMLRKGYHFVVHDNGKLTLLCNHEDFVLVQKLIKEWFNYPSYSKGNPDSLDIYIKTKQELIQNEKTVNEDSKVNE